MTSRIPYRRRTGICLNMIVRNEARNLPRLFASLQGQVDYFVIADTGSTDETPALLVELGKQFGIPGEVHGHPQEHGP